jgi:uncharacterized repeat protein (TIGR01451 family)
MRLRLMKVLALTVAGLATVGMSGCQNTMPHSMTWPGTGDIVPTHAKPPEGGYYQNWDPYAVSLEVTPIEDLNPVRTQHVLVATVKDKDGKALPNRRVEWIVAEGSVGDLIEVDESGWRASRGYKVTEKYAVSHTNNFKHVLDRGTDDPSDDIQLEPGQTWCTITSPIEGDTHIIVYAPGIYDWNKHKVFAVKHWYDVQWQFPPPATNPVGTSHEFVTNVGKFSDGSPLADYIVTYKIIDGPAAVLEPGGGQTATVKTDASGMAKVTIKQAKPVEGTNNISIDIQRKECGECKPMVHIATGATAKTWIGPKIACDKTAPAAVLAGQQFEYHISVSNPSKVDAKDVVVTDTLPDGVSYVSSNPPAEAKGQSLSWSLGVVAPGSDKAISIQAKATKTGKFENCAEVKAAYDLSSRCCATTVVTSPKLAIEKRCPQAVTVCDPIEYVIIVRNAGDGPATHVQVNDALPDGLLTTDKKRAVTADVGDLGPGQSKELRFTVNASKTGKYENTVTAKADGGLTAEATCTTVVTKPELQVTKKGPESRYIGRPAVYEITVKNTGDAPARDTILTDTVPAGTEFTQASDGGKFASGVVTWSLGTLEPGASKKVTVTLKPTAAGTVKNVATAKAYCAEASAEASMPVKGVAAILLECVDDPDPIEVGGQLTYTIIVTNQGTAPDTNIVIECTLPAGEEYVSSDGPTKAAISGKTVKFSPIPSLAPKAKLAYKVVVKGVKEGDVRFKTELTSDCIETPVQETESTHIYQ